MLWWDYTGNKGIATLIVSPHGALNSLAPGRSECNSENGIFSLVLLIGIFRSSHNNALWWMPQDLTDDKSILVQVMAWCRQAWRHQAITWANVDSVPSRLVASLGHKWVKDKNFHLTMLVVSEFGTRHPLSEIEITNIWKSLNAVKHFYHNQICLQWVCHFIESYDLWYWFWQ